MRGSEICESGFYGKDLQSLPTDYEEEVYDFEGLDDTEDFSIILTDRGEDKTRNSIQLAPGAIQTKEEIEAMTFANEIEAYDWYNLYELTLGFGFRRCNCKYFNPETKEDIKSRIFVCARQGLRSDKYTNMENRKREHTRNSRVLCKARIKIARTSSSEPFRVKFFQPIHSHELADPQCVRNYRSHRKVPESDVELILSLKEVGIRYCQAYLLMVKQAGGYCNLPYTQKDMYNKMRSMEKVYSNHGDGQQTLLYIDSLAVSHHAVFMRYNLGENNELQGVFWCDKRSYIDYMRFGDVLVFDATYKTNMYLKPFVILSGVNNHYKTTVFACAILNDEKIPSYEWVLQCLMEAMHNKQPLSVITDGDLSMKSAIESTFPNARHRLCSWHICRNAQANLKLGSKFLSDFKRCMHSRKPDPYWHNEWHAMVQKWNLADNNWIQVTYMNRRMWAETYLKDHFFALQTSTSRCESINSFFKRHMSCRDRLIDVCKGFVTGLDRLRNNECKDHFKSDQSDPVLTTAFPHLEAHALVIYTHKVYKMFKVEAEKAEGYTLLETTHDEERNVDFYYVRKGEMKTTVVVKLMDRVEAIFIKHFVNGNRDKGMNTLRPKMKKERHMVSFFTGVSFGGTMALLIALILIIRARNIVDNPNNDRYMDNMFPLYSLFAFIVFHMLLYAGNIYFWRKYRVNYTFILGFKEGTQLGYREILLLDMELDPKTKDYKAVTELVPLALVVLFVIILFCPLNIIYCSSRYLFLGCLWRSIAAPLYKVTLPDFLLVDQLTSQFQALRSLEFYICYYGWGDYKHRQNTCQSNDVYNTFYFIAAAIPFWWRFLQCVRRCVEERDTWQGLNAMKYFSTIVAICARTAYTLNKSQGWNVVAWITSIISGISVTYWGIVIDWGLLQRHSKNRWLRDNLLVPHKSVYHVAMVSNMIFRFAWFQILLDLQVPFLHRQTLTAIVAAVEILRHGVWNFFRLENEHLNNVENYRAFKSVPLPFNYEEDEDKDE